MTDSKSIQRRIAAQKGEPVPDLSSEPLPTGVDLYYVANKHLHESPPEHPTDRDSIVVLASDWEEVSSRLAASEERVAVLEAAMERVALVRSWGDAREIADAALKATKVADKGSSK